MNQPYLIPLDPVRLKEGKDHCPACGKVMKAFCKTMDKELAELAYDALKVYLDRGAKPFQVREITEDRVKFAMFQRLGYWGLVKHTDLGAPWWIFTEKGIGFLCGGWKVPKKVWVFNRRIIEESEEKVAVDELSPRWQTSRSDFTLDYLPYKYRSTFPLAEVPGMEPML